MQSNPVEEWQRLTALYSEMGEIELRELAAGIGGLTEVAQQVLRDELKRRGLSEKPPAARPRALNSQDDEQWQSSEEGPRNVDEDGADLHEYTWKTDLCECQSLAEAEQRCEMLRLEGIESWIERPGSRRAIPWNELGVGGLLIRVAADQLDQAKEVAARPIPQEIIAQWKKLEDAPTYELPSCPKCGAPDPLLESVDPTNSWHCESCENDWTDPGEDPGADTEKSA
jgi:ribosomal protein L37AE/L43A